MYKDVEEISEESEFLELIRHSNPIEIIQLIKQVDNIKLGENWYKYKSCVFRPSVDDKEDVLDIFVELVG